MCLLLITGGKSQHTATESGKKDEVKNRKERRQQDEKKLVVNTTQDTNQHVLNSSGRVTLQAIHRLHNKTFFFFSTTNKRKRHTDHKSRWAVYPRPPCKQIAHHPFYLSTLPSAKSCVVALPSKLNNLSPRRPSWTQQFASSSFVLCGGCRHMWQCREKR